jgi:hypothetical protein
MNTKWKRAVIHLEAAADELAWEEQRKRIDQFHKEWQKGERPVEEIAAELLPRGREIRCRGTAVFLTHKNRRYLVTARHVLTDPKIAAGAPGMDTPAWVPEIYPGERQERHQQRIDNWIFPIIFRVPSLDEVKAGGVDRPLAFLMNLAAGVTWMLPYTFSTPALDLAVISLDQSGLTRTFADELVSVGFAPATLDDVAAQPSAEGAEIYSVGYPDATATLGTLPLHQAVAHWASSAFSVPVSAFGRVGMLRDDLDHFLADMSIYPGNSGGPVIEDDKMVGIVSAQARVEEVRVPFAVVTKSSFIASLIEQQAAKDSQVETVHVGSS